MTVTLQPTQGLAFLVLTPPMLSLALATSVYFTHLSQSLTGEVLRNNGITCCSRQQLRGDVLLPGHPRPPLPLGVSQNSINILSSTAFRGMLVLFSWCYSSGLASSRKRLSYSPRITLALKSLSSRFMIVARSLSNSRWSAFFAVSQRAVTVRGCSQGLFSQR